MNNINYVLLCVIYLWVSKANSNLNAQNNYYVSVVDGIDTNDGKSITAPFKTIQKAADIIQPGETIFIRGGVYREEISIMQSGSEGRPIIFTPYNNEEVIITTTDLLTDWTLKDGSIYRANFDSSIIPRNKMTIFVNGEWVNEAHWSSIKSNADILNSDEYSTVDSYSSTSITDSSLTSFSDDYWNGAYVYIQVNDWSIWPRKITDFDGETGTITINAESFETAQGYKYLIFDSYNALDSSGEWYFDDDSNELYLWTPDGSNPNNDTVEVKTREECFVLNGNDYIQIEGLNLRGGDIDMEGANNNLLQNCHIYYPDWNFGMDSDFDIYSLKINGSNNIIRDNEIEGTCGQFIILSGSNNSIVNNYFHNLGYNNCDGAAICISKCNTGNLISHNTFTKIGHSAISSNYGGYRFIIQYNEFSKTCMLTTDVGAIGFGNGSFNNSIVHHNVFHDMAAVSAGFYMDFNGFDILVHNNIFYNSESWGMKLNIPATNIFYINNTIFSRGEIHSSFLSDFSEAKNVGIYNNIYTYANQQLSNRGATLDGNCSLDSSSEFSDVTTGDFTLQSGSEAIDQGIEIKGITDGFTGSAPDAGAIEYGEEMWKFGHDFNDPPDPEYNWYSIDFSSFISNSSFEMDLDYWDTATGSPDVINVDPWNYRSESLGLSGGYALELKSGDEVTQDITGLLPDTYYKLSTKARIMRKDIKVAYSYGDLNGTFTFAHYANQYSISDIDAGEWLRFDNIDFGDQKPLYNYLELGVTLSNNYNIELRLDDLNGTLLAKLNYQEGDSYSKYAADWGMLKTYISSITGTHSVYLKFTNASAGHVDRIRFMNTEYQGVNIGARNFDEGNNDISENIGYCYWTGEEGVIFKTGVTSTTATVYLNNNLDNNFNGYIDNVSLIKCDTIQSPKNANTVPGIIQAEDFDIGGQGISYNIVELEVNDNPYRSDIQNVNIATIYDSAIGYSVNDFENGDWLEYTLNDIVEGEYDLKMRYLKDNNDTCRVIVKLNNNTLGYFKPEYTGDSLWQEITINDISIGGLEGEEDILRIWIPDGDINIDYINFMTCANFSVSGEVTGSISDSNNGKIILTAKGGTEPYAYLWTDSVTLMDRANLAADDYSVTVTDSVGCSEILSFTVEDLCENFSVSGTVTDCTEQINNGAISLIVSGGEEAFIYLWSDGSTNKDRANLSVGEYTVIVTDDNGCTKSQNFNVDNLYANFTVSGEVTGSISDSNNGTITLEISGEVGETYSYLWSDGSTSKDRIGLSPGNYTVTITDSSGLSVTENYIIDDLCTDFSLSGIAIGSLSNVNTGAITLTIEGGEGPCGYLWSDGETTKDRTSLAAGNYSVTVTDNNGCKETQSYIVDDLCQDFNVSSRIISSDYEENNGEIVLSIDGGKAPYVYSWSNEKDDAYITKLKAGSYSVIVKDANGCELEKTFIVEENPILFKLVKVHPIPTTGLIAVEYGSPNDGTVIVDIHDYIGESVKKYTINTTKGYNKTSIYLGNEDQNEKTLLPNGKYEIYFIMDGDSFNFPVIKKE